MTVPERHQLKIARNTMHLSCVGALILGGPNHKDAAFIIRKLTGQALGHDPRCTCKETD